ncbi:hypothetical protein [Ralstonia pseudosolanacearum]|uniref:hypothetical protein n=1 Tax=Ralstonia pseudosolanacearum TaxID=1310165 RepID=UPI001FF7B48C|nr:hypothetical protein [Ralstonia pseudosolanacearum]
MSFLKNLLTGFEGHSCAHNAYLAELVLRNLPEAKRIPTVVALYAVLRRGSTYRKLDEFALNDVFDAFPRVTQLNFLALAMQELANAWPGEPWLQLRNPLWTTMDAKDVRLSADHFRHKHGLSANIEGEPLRLGEWVAEGLLTRR